MPYKIELKIKEIHITIWTMKVLIKNKCKYLENLRVENVFYNTKSEFIKKKTDNSWLTARTHQRCKKY